MTLLSHRYGHLPLVSNHEDNREAIRSKLKDWLHHPQPHDRIAQLKGPHGGGKTHFIRESLGLPNGEGFALSDLLHLGERPFFYVDLSRFSRVSELQSHLWELAYGCRHESNSLGAQMHLHTRVSQALSAPEAAAYDKHATLACERLSQAFIVFDQLDECRLDDSACFLKVVESLVQHTHAQVLLVGELPIGHWNNAARGAVHFDIWCDFLARCFHDEWELKGTLEALIQGCLSLVLGEALDLLLIQAPDLIARIKALLRPREVDSPVEDIAERPLNGHACRKVLLKTAELWLALTPWELSDAEFLKLLDWRLGNGLFDVIAPGPLTWMEHTLPSDLSAPYLERLAAVLRHT